MRFPKNSPTPDAERARPARLTTVALAAAFALAAVTAVAIPTGASAEEALSPVVETSDTAAAAGAALPEPAPAETSQPAPADASAEPETNVETEIEAETTVEAGAGTPTEGAAEAETETGSDAEADAPTLALEGTDAAPALQAGPVDNHAPVAADDHYTMSQGGTLVVDAPGFLANDSDPDGDVIVGDHTSVFVAGFSWQPFGGSVYYTPSSDLVGTIAIDYWLRDVHGTLSNAATIVIEVLPAGAGDPTPMPEDPCADPDAAIDESLETPVAPESDCPPTPTGGAGDPADGSGTERPTDPGAGDEPQPAGLPNDSQSAALAETGTPALPMTALAGLLAALGLALNSRRIARR